MLNDKIKKIKKGIKKDSSQPGLTTKSVTWVMIPG